MAQNPFVTKNEITLYEAEFSPKAIAELHDIDLKSILDFSLNVNPFGPPATSQSAASEMLAECGNYPDLYLAQLRSKVAQKHGISENMLLFGAGLDDILKLIVQAWATPGDTAVIHIPTFPRYELESKLHGLKVTFVESRRPWEVDINALKDAYHLHKPALAFICTPNNPTGTIIPVTDIKELAGEFPNTIFIVDEALIHPDEDGAISLVREKNNIAVLRTFSKYYGIAGYRVGYAISNDLLISSLSIAKPPFNVSLVSAAAALAVLNDQKFLNRTKKLLDAERDYVCKELSTIPGFIIRGSYSNMILLQMTNLNSSTFCKMLGAKGIIVADGKSFRGLENFDMLRISIKDRNRNMILINSIKEAIRYSYT